MSITKLWDLGTRSSWMGKRRDRETSSSPQARPENTDFASTMR